MPRCATPWTCANRDLVARNVQLTEIWVLYVRSVTLPSGTKGIAANQMNELLSELFSSKVRAAVLCHMLPRPQAAFSLTEFSRILDLPISSLQHECYKLERIGVIRGRREGNSRRYRVDATCPVLPELTALIVAAMGQEAAIRAALSDVPGLDAAFVARNLPIRSTRSGWCRGRAPTWLAIPRRFPTNQPKLCCRRGAAPYIRGLDQIPCVTSFGENGRSGVAKQS
jgi:DNA-binding transcriptional ArsR family regulator